MTAIYYIDQRTALMWHVVAGACAIDAVAWIRVNGWPGAAGIVVYAALAIIGYAQARRAMRR